MRTLNISNSDKITILLNRLDFHTNEIQRREETETRLFEWATAMLLGVFIAVIALSGSSGSALSTTVNKVIASLLIGIPACLFSFRILGERRSQARQAAIIEKIENELKLFDKGFYLSANAVYPHNWQNNLAKSMLQRKTPVIYAAITVLMTLLVMLTIWLI